MFKDLDKKIRSIINKDGASLVEVLVGITIMAVVIIGFTAMFLTSTTLYSKGKEKEKSSNQLYSMIESKDKGLELVKTGVKPLSFRLQTEEGDYKDLPQGLSMKMELIEAEVVFGKTDAIIDTLKYDNTSQIKLEDLSSGSHGWFEDVELIHYRHKYVNKNGVPNDRNISNFFKIGSYVDAKKEIDDAIAKP